MRLAPGQVNSGRGKRIKVLKAGKEVSHSYKYTYNMLYTVSKNVKNPLLVQ